MDALDFCIFVSGRFTYDQAMAKAEITGDAAMARAVLKDLLILF